jgi:hypothetical protein
VRHNPGSRRSCSAGAVLLASEGVR